MKIVALILLLILTAQSFAGTTDTSYLSGPKLREKMLAGPQKEIYAQEFGKYVTVPLNYNDPSQGTTQVYYFTRKPFDPKKPTFVFFQGGPGGSGHSNIIFDPLFSWNVVFMDYRGIAFSQPATLEELKNTNYFSSEFTARDAKAVLYDLGVKMASVYGHSYGTVVATLFAHLFPESTTAVILEGTIYSGESTIWSSPRRRKMIQKYFDKLSEPMKEKIIALSNRDGVEKAWFSREAQQHMYRNNFETSLTRSLTQLFKLDEKTLLERISFNPDKILTLSDSIAFSVHYFAQIACRELSAQAQYASFGFVFENRTLVPEENKNVKLACDKLTSSKAEKQTYNASLYKLKVPITYFQGVTDGATTANEAIYHYKNVPETGAQIFIVKNAGHSPLQDMLMMSAAEKNIPAKLLLYALQGKTITLSEFKQLREDRLPNWTMTSK